MCVLLGGVPAAQSRPCGTRDRVPLSEELALACDLLAIEKVRFGARLISRPAHRGKRTLTCPGAAVLLQPLVENAVTHGIAQCLGGAAPCAWTRGATASGCCVAIENPRDASRACPPRPRHRDRQNVRVGVSRLPCWRDASCASGPEGMSSRSSGAARARGRMTPPAGLPLSGR